MQRSLWSWVYVKIILKHVVDMHLVIHTPHFSNDW